MVEADLHHGDADHLAMIANGLRIVETGLAARRADAIEAPRSMLKGVVKVGPVGEVHADKARLLVPVARGKRETAGVEHVEHRAVGFGVNFGQIHDSRSVGDPGRRGIAGARRPPAGARQRREGNRTSPARSQGLPRRDRAYEFPRHAAARSRSARPRSRRCRVRLRQSITRAAHAHGERRGGPSASPGCVGVDVVYSWPLRIRHETRCGRSMLRFACPRRNPHAMAERPPFHCMCCPPLMAILAPVTNAASSEQR